LAPGGWAGCARLNGHLDCDVALPPDRVPTPSESVSRCRIRDRGCKKLAGLLDPQRSTVQLISAGHGPLLFYSSAQDRFDSVDAQGPPLGLLPRFSYAGPRLLKFDSGDILVLVTDGFIEWANSNDEEFGIHRIQDVIRAHRDKSSAGIISELHSAVVRFGGHAAKRRPHRAGSETGLKDEV
jgi:serine phosphatase RsbU (regulator of sigma subunit)